jgi:hypothetical protein
LKGLRAIRYRRVRAAAAALALGLLVPAATAGQAVSVSVEPAETRIAPGEFCTLYVHVGGEVDSLSCSGFRLGFDPSVVSCEAAGKWGLYTSTPFPTFFDWGLPSADTVRVEGCVLGYRTYVLPPGALYMIVFEAVDAGLTDVTIGTAELWDIDRYPLEEQVTGAGTIIVTTQTGGRVPGPGAGSLSNFPNPFNPATTLVLEIPEGVGLTKTEIDIYDPAGRLVRRLFSGPVPAGRSEFRWDGLDDSGSAVGSGVYLALSRSGSLSLERKLVLLR